MEIYEIEKEKMDSLKALADVNERVSKAVELVEKLKLEESVYIKEREEIAVKKINDVLLESQTVLQEALKNYIIVHDLSKTAASFTEKIEKTYTDFEETKKTFTKFTGVWEKNIAAREEELNEIKKLIKVDRIQVKNDKEALERREKAIKEDERKNKDMRETLERAINRLNT